MSDRIDVLPQYLMPKQAMTAFGGLVANHRGGELTTRIIRWFVGRYDDARAVDWPTLNACVLTYARGRRLEGATWGLLLVWQRDAEQGWQRYQRIDHVLHSGQVGRSRLDGYFCKPDGSLVQALGFCVHATSRQLLARIAERHDPDVVLFGDEHDHLHALHPGSERDVGPYHPGLVAQLCAEVRRSDLRFLGFDFPPSHWIQARMALAYVRDRGLPVLPPATPRAPGSAAR